MSVTELVNLRRSCEGPGRLPDLVQLDAPTWAKVNSTTVDALIRLVERNNILMR